MAKALFGLVALLAAGVGYMAFSQWQFDQLSKSLEADIATFERLRWERPVLRMPAIEGNSAEALYEALSGRTRLDDGRRRAIAEALHFGQPLQEDEAGTLQAWKLVTAALHDATRHTWSATRLQIRRGSELRVPDYPLLMDGALVMLAAGAQEGGDACLRTVSDVVRMGQDLVPGAPLQAAGVSARMAAIAARVAGFCTAAATGAGLRKAAAEFRILATEAPPTGTGIEVADLLAAVDLRRQAALTVHAGYADFGPTIRARSRLFKAWTALSHPSRWRQITPDAYPDAVAKWRAEQDWRVRSGQLPLQRATAGVLEWLYEDQRGQAVVRCLALGFATLAERDRRGRTPRELVGIRDSALRDPFGGAPMRFRVAQDGSELTVWSVGEDLRDDVGTEEWDLQAPLDVSVQLRMPVLQRSGKGRRGRDSRKR